MPKKAPYTQYEYHITGNHPELEALGLDGWRLVCIKSSYLNDYDTGKPYMSHQWVFIREITDRTDTEFPPVRDADMLGRERED